jgi:hypothetical protein
MTKAQKANRKQIPITKFHRLDFLGLAIAPKKPRFPIASPFRQSSVPRELMCSLFKVYGFAPDVLVIGD